ncbi:MAG TPA: hypothetical protein VJQ77_06245 [Novosphingobium sp.]|nr:hypothetical protein [Novosphingobium sp.]
MRFQEWALALAPAAILCALLTRPVWDVDIFWQLRLGEMILQHRGPILREPFAASHLGEPLPAIAWLAQAAYAEVRLLGGWNALRAFDALCWLGGFCSLVAACRARGAAPVAAVIALLLSVMAALPTASVRPQSFAALCFGLLLALLRLELRPLYTVALAVPLLVLWQNLHPSVAVGAVALGASAAAGWLARWRDREETMPLAATILAPVAVAAMFATPDGLSVLAVSARNARASLAIDVAEWLPMWAPANRANSMGILFAAAVTLWLVLGRPRRIVLTELAVAATLFAMTVVTTRFVLFWAISTIPVIARAAADPVSSRIDVPKWVAPLAILAAAIAVPQARPTRFDSSLPLDAIERLRQANVRGVVYADFPYGGPIIDAGYPDWRVAYDGRYYRYTTEEWRFNGDIESGELGLRDILRKWRVAGFLLKVSHNTPLARELARTPGWTCIWDRDGIVVYVRADKKAAG